MITKFLILAIGLTLIISDTAMGQKRPKSPPSPPKNSPPPSRSSAADDEYLSDECPEPNGYFADELQCDKYYECIDGAVTEKLCPDGMVFNDFSPKHEKCDLPFNIDCSQRPERQKPKPSLHCPRQNGYFGHEEANVCDKFYYCVDGKYNMITCPDGLVYNERTGICTWPDEAKKKGCSSQAFSRNASDEGGGIARTKRLTIWMNKKFQPGYYHQEVASNPGRWASEEETSTSEEENRFGSDSAAESIYGPNSYYLDGPMGFSPLGSRFGRSGGEQAVAQGPPPPGGNRRKEFSLLDGYIRAYIAQKNDNPPSPPADMRLYERIAEQVYERMLRQRRMRTQRRACPDHQVRHNAYVEVFQFNCPKVNGSQAQQHPRYPDPEDCQFFYVCINGETPRRNGCKLGQVFNEATGRCDWPRNVPECLDWYKDVLTEEELYALEHPKPRPRPSGNAGANRRKPAPKDDE